MFGLNPVALYAIAFLVFTNLFTFAGWRLADHEADKQERRAIVSEEKLNLFAEQVRIEGEKQTRRTAEIIANGKKITEDMSHEYAKNLDRLRTDYQRLRKQYADSSGGGLSKVPDSAKSIDAIPADCLPLAADAAETTLTLVALQEWVTEQQHITKEQK
jgi:hypothetical protein